VKTLKDLGISANVTRGNLTVVYGLDISPSPLSLDGSCIVVHKFPPYLCMKTTILTRVKFSFSLRVHNTVDWMDQHCCR
jgi:hypothetical protein